MSRVQVPLLDQLRLQPAARPTDQFVTPGVVNSNKGGSLIQLASALSRNNDKVQGILDHRFEAETSELVKRAAGDIAARQIKNRDDLKTAVDAGLLPDVKNPYYRDQLQTEVAKIEAGQAVVNARLDYEKLKETLGDNQAALEDIWKRHTEPLLKDHHPSDVAAVAPYLEGQRAQFINQWIGDRDQQVKQDRRLTVPTVLRQSMQTVSSESFRKAGENDAPAVAQVDALAADLQRQLDETGKTVPQSELLEMIYGAVESEAMTRGAGGGEIARQLMNKLTTTIDGKPVRLSDVGTNPGRLEQLTVSLRTRSVQLARVDEDRRSFQVTQERRGLEDHMFGWIRENPGRNPLDYHFPPEMVAKVLPEAYFEAQSRHATLLAQAEQQGKLSEDAKANLLAGEMAKHTGNTAEDIAARESLREAFIAIGKPHLYASVLQMQREERQYRKVETESGVMPELSRLFTSGKFSKGVLDDLQKQGRISDDDYQQALRLYGGLRNTLGHEVVGTQVERLRDQVTRSFLIARNITDPADLKFSGATGKLQLDLTTAEQQFLQRVETWTTDHPNATTSEKLTEVDKLRDTVARDMQALGWDDLMKHSSFKPADPSAPPTPPAVTQPPPKAGEAPTQDAALGQLVQADPVAGRISRDEINAVAGVLKSGPKVDKETYLRLWEPSVTYTGAESLPYNGRESTDYTSRLLDIRNATPMPTPVGTFGIGNLGDQPQPTTEAAQSYIDRKAADYRERALGQRLALKQRIINDDVVGKYKTLAAEIGRRGSLGGAFVTPEERRKVIVWTSMLREYSHMSEVVGYTPDEVKQMPGEKAWTRALVVGSVSDLSASSPRFRRVLKELELPREDIPLFVASQRRILDRVQSK
jgi:hypothetical protein